MRRRLAAQNPLDDRTLYGRDTQIAQVVEVLTAGTGVAAISAIQGHGGIGKTALAHAVAARPKITARFPDGVLIVDLKGATDAPKSVQAAAVELARRLRPDLPAIADEVQALDAYRAAFAGRRALVLLDDARNRDQVQPLRPPPGNGLLVTSRARFDLQGGTSITLGLLSAEDAAALLRGRVPDLTPEAAAEIARLCDGLPLALNAAAEVLAEADGWDADSFARALDDAPDRTELLGAADGSLSGDVARVLSLSVERLREAAPDLLAPWAALSVCAGRLPPERLAPVIGLEETAARNALTRLTRRGLVLKEGDGLRLHDLMRPLAAGELDAETQAAAELRHAEMVLTEMREIQELQDQGGAKFMEGLARFDRLRPEFEAAFARMAARSGADDRAAAICSALPLTARYTLSLRETAAERRDRCTAALAAARRIGNRAREGKHLGNLGLAHADLGEPRTAIGYYEQRLEIAREIGDRRGEWQTLGNLGIAYEHLGEPRTAIDYYNRVLEISREIGDRRGEGNALGNLGSAYLTLGEPRTAIGYYEQHLDIAREIGDRRGEGATFGNLGIAYQDLGEPRTAIDYYTQQFDVVREIGDRRGEGNALWNRALAEITLGDTAEALSLARRALEIRDAIGDPNDDIARRVIAAWEAEDGRA